MTIHRACCAWGSASALQWSTGGVGAGASCEEDAARTGTHGLRLAPSSQNSDVPRQFSASIDGVFVAQCYITPRSLTDASIGYWGSSGQANVSGYRLRYDAASGTLQVVTVNASGTILATSQGPEVDPDVTYRIDFRFRGSAFPTGRAFDWMVDGAAQPQLSGSSGPSGLLWWVWGRQTSMSFITDVDDIAMVYTNDEDPDQSEVDALYPLRPGSVKTLMVVANGPNAGEGSFAASLGAIADSWQLLDDLPFHTTSGYVEQNVIGTGDYLAYTFEQLAAADIDIVALSVVFEKRSSSFTNPNDAAVHLIDGATDITVYDGDWRTSTVDVRGEDLVSNQPFTRGRINALEARWGYSSDVTDTPRLGGLCLEVALGDFVAAEITPEGDTIYYDQLEATE